LVGPVIAVGMTAVFGVIALATLLYVYVLIPSKPALPAVSAEEIEAQVDEGRKSLADGHYSDAAESLAKAQSNLAGQPGLLTPAGRRQLAQLHRQAAILADWPREPLDKILARTGSLNEDEWRAVAGNYKGKTAVLDLSLRRDASRQYHVDFTRPMVVARLRLELQNLKLLDSLPLDARERVVFAASIAEIRREDRGAFNVRFEPDSGVLLTDVNANVLGEVPDAAFRALLERQKTWAAELP
jgi:hypothetical protein